MKFEKFLKNVGTRGIIVNSTKYGKFLLFGNVMLRIPDGVNIMASFTKIMPEWQETIFRDFRDGYITEAELTDAALPTPDATPSQIKRIFEDAYDGRIAIDNKTFGVIERSDRTYIYPEDYEDNNNANVSALLVTTGHGDDETITGIVFDEHYYTEMMEKE